MHTRR
jgi:hypothetical protein